MEEIAMTEDQRKAVKAALDAGEMVWMVQPAGGTIGFKFEDGEQHMEQVAARLALGYTLTTSPRKG